MTNKIPLNLPIELIDFICEKLYRKLLVRITIIKKCENNPFFLLNKNRIENYWKKTSNEELIKNGDLQGIKYTRKLDRIFGIGCHCLEYASKYGQLEIVKYFVKYRQFIPYPQLLHNALINACAYGHLEIVKYLTSLRGESNIKNNVFAIHLQVACGQNHLEIVKFFAENGIDITIKKNIAFVEACKNGNLEIAKYLVSLGADFRVQNDWPLLSACHYGQLHIAKYLISLGVEINDYEAINTAKIQGHVDVAKYLKSIRKN